MTLYWHDVDTHRAIFLRKFRYEEVESMLPQQNYGYPMPNYFDNSVNRYGNCFQQPQIQPQMQQTSLPGKYVSDFNQINANDVPMDGSVAIFIKNDLSELQARSWTANGTISTLSFIPQKENKNVSMDTLSPNDNSVKIDLLDELTKVFNERFDKIEKILKPSRAKKEGVENE